MSDRKLSQQELKKNRIVCGHYAMYVGTHTCFGNFHICDVHLDTIKVLFIHQQMH